MRLFVGYSWLCDVGTGTDSASLLASRLMAILCGVGTAFRLDEFGMWLNVRDLYWAREGRGIEAVILFGALLAARGLGAPCFPQTPEAATRIEDIPILMRGQLPSWA